MPGAFAEYTYQNSRNLTVVAGLRADRHNLYGWQLTPRLNLKYDAAEEHRAARCRRPRLPRGQPHCRQRRHAGQRPRVRHRHQPAARKGLEPGRQRHAVLHGAGPPGHVCGRLLPHRISRTRWWPICTPRRGHHSIDNLQPGGRSFARSLQAELQVEPLKGLQVKGAYKYLDVRTTYDDVAAAQAPHAHPPRLPEPGLRQRFRQVAGRFHGAVVWAAARWRTSAARTPHGTGQEYAPETAPRYALLNTQLTRAFKRLEVYVGVENLTNYRQPNPIEGAANPFGPTFDAAMVWGPVYGRLTYAGLRYRIE